MGFFSWLRELFEYKCINKDYDYRPDISYVTCYKNDKPVEVHINKQIGEWQDYGYRSEYQRNISRLYWRKDNPFKPYPNDSYYFLNGGY